MTPDGHINYPLDTSRTQRTRFDNNSKIKRDDIKLFMVAAFGCLFANELIEA